MGGGEKLPRMRRILKTFTFALSLLSGSAFAVPILGVTASTTNIPASGSAVSHVVDGSGLSAPNDPSATHAFDSSDNSFGTLDDPNTVNYTFNLNGLYNLAGMAVWNRNVSNTSGIQGVTVTTSTDGVLFTAFTGSPTQFAQKTVFPSSSQQFAWTPVLASYVRFQATSNYGSSFTGLSEVLFDGTAVVVGAPELGRTGSMAPLLSVCLTLLIFSARGRRIPSGTLD